MRRRRVLRSLSVGFVGNPNCGKTTLFNAFTGAGLMVGNWPGVTVERVEDGIEYQGREIKLTDLPGIYSLASYTAEERAAGRWIREGGADVLINVADASSLERSLYLTTELLEAGCPVVLALNMMDVVRKRGMRIDTERLSAGLGNIPVIPVSARKREGLEELLRAAVLAADGRPPCPEEPPDSQPHPPAHTLEASAASASKRYDCIERLLSRCMTGGEERRGLTDKADRLVVHPVWGVLFFWGIMALVFFAAFGVGGAMKGGLEGILQRISRLAELLLRGWEASPWVISLVTDGALAGVGGILAFLPGLAALFLFLAILEDSGYMARAAYVMNEAMGFAGLSGRACVPLLLGFGCSVPAVLAARIMEDGSARQRTIRMIPFMSCSAKLPVYMLFLEMFFPDHGAVLCVLLYGAGIGAAILTGSLSRLRAELPGKKGERLLLELPDYRLPDGRTVARSVGTRLSDYLFKAGTTIFSASVVLWFLLHMGPAGYEGSLEGSFAALIGKGLVPLLKPAGLGFWQIAVALIFGIAAKEMIVSGLFVLCGAGDALFLASQLAAEGFGPANGLALLVFCLFYVPCIAALAVIRRESGSLRLTLGVVLRHLALAWAAAAVAFQLGRVLF